MSSIRPVDSFSRGSLSPEVEAFFFEVRQYHKLSASVEIRVVRLESFSKESVLFEEVNVAQLMHREFLSQNASRLAYLISQGSGQRSPTLYLSDEMRSKAQLNVINGAVQMILKQQGGSEELIEGLELAKAKEEVFSQLAAALRSLEEQGLIGVGLNLSGDVCNELKGKSSYAENVVFQTMNFAPGKRGQPEKEYGEQLSKQLKDSQKDENARIAKKAQREHNKELVNLGIIPVTL